MSEAERGIESLLSQGWKNLEAVEFKGRLFFPEKIFKRTAKGDLAAEDIYLRVPREHEIRKARAEARRIAKEDGIDPEKDADLFETLDNICLLHLAIRNPKPQHEPLVGFPHELEENYDSASLAQVARKLRALMVAIDPVPPDLTEEQLLAVVAALAKDRTVLPLAVCDPASQHTCILYMAARLQSYLDSKSSSEPSDSSMLE